MICHESMRRGPFHFIWIRPWRGHERGARKDQTIRLQKKCFSSAARFYCTTSSCFYYTQSQWCAMDSGLCLIVDRCVYGWSNRTSDRSIERRTEPGSLWLTPDHRSLFNKCMCLAGWSVQPLFQRWFVKDRKYEFSHVNELSLAVALECRTAALCGVWACTSVCSKR